jgi:hypothetical protein
LLVVTLATCTLYTFCRYSRISVLVYFGSHRNKYVLRGSSAEARRTSVSAMFGKNDFTIASLSHHAPLNPSHALHTHIHTPTWVHNELHGRRATPGGAPTVAQIARVA